MITNRYINGLVVLAICKFRSITMCFGSGFVLATVCTLKILDYVKLVYCKLRVLNYCSSNQLVGVALSKLIDRNLAYMYI